MTHPFLMRLSEQIFQIKAVALSQGVQLPGKVNTGAAEGDGSAGFGENVKLGK